MKKYIVHLFDVDNSGSIKIETETIKEIFCNTDDEAIEQGELLRQQRNIEEPLPENKDWGKVEWLHHVYTTDTDGYADEILV